MLLAAIYTIHFFRISSFFFLIIPPPPRSTLFPYTTLFRSRRPPQRHSSAISARSYCHGCYWRSYWCHGRLRHRSAWHRDRKSTRLNSSHVAISYAVFCLKKKKKQHQPTETVVTT